MCVLSGCLRKRASTWGRAALHVLRCVSSVCLWILHGERGGVVLFWEGASEIVRLLGEQGACYGFRFYMPETKRLVAEKAGCYDSPETRHNARRGRGSGAAVVMISGFACT